MYYKKIIVMFIILSCLSCSGLKRPTNIVRTATETEIADLNVDFYPESIVISPDVLHIAYVEDVYSGLTVVFDSIPGDRFDDISTNIVFSPTNDYLAYFGYHEGYSGGIFGLFATDPYWEVVVADNTYGKYQDMLNNSLVISPDGKHIAYGVLNFYNASVYLDHKPLPEVIYSEDPTLDSVYVYDVFEPFLFSPDSKKFAYVAETVDDDKWAYSVVVNDRAGKGYDDVYSSSLTFSPDSKRLAYVVIDSLLERVVINEEELPGYDAVSETSIRFSPDSNHLAYAAFDGDKWFVVHEEKKSAPYDDIGQIVYSPDSKHLAFTAQQNEDWVVIRDEKEISRSSGIVESTLTFSPDSKHLVYAVAADSGIVMYEGVKPIGFYQALVTPPVFSSDGRYLVYTIEEDNTQSVVVNGVKGHPYPAIISHNGGRIVFNDNNSIHYIALKDDDKVYLVEESF